MATATTQSPPEQRVILKNVSWATYEDLLAGHVSSSVPHFTYDQGVLEIVSPSTGHEEANRTLAILVEVVAEERSINLRNVGSMPFKRKDLLRGVELDTSFYIHSVSLVAGKAEIDAATDPPPDLVIEIDVSSSSLDMLSIYAQVGIPEVWRYQPGTDRVTILRLDGDKYAERDESIAVPPLTRSVLTRFVVTSRSLDRLEWLRTLRAWVRGSPGSA